MDNFEAKGLAQFIKKIKDLHESNTDKYTMYGDIRLNGSGEILIRDMAQYDTTPIFISQLTSKLGIPAKYWSRIENVPNLQAKNVNCLLKDDFEHKCLIRFQGLYVRAFLSNKFLKLDHIYLLNEFLEYIEKACKKYSISYSTMDMVVGRISDKKMYLAVLPYKRSNYKTYQGFAITNSEVGVAAFQVYSFIYIKDVGTIYDKGILYRRHITSAKSGTDAFYESQSINEELANLRHGIDDVCKSIKYGEHKHMIEQIEYHMGITIDSPSLELNKWMTMFPILKKYKKDFDARILAGEWRTEKSVIKSLVKFANKLNNYEDAFEIQQSAWGIVSAKSGLRQSKSYKEHIKEGLIK